MSTDHFQTKYASFMEVLVKSTIAETTKLFETVVDELKTEISKLKAENEALKTTCRQKAEARTFAISDSGQSSLLTMRDSAVQCDRGQIFLFVEPVGQIINQEGEQCQEEEVVYLLLNNHDSDAAKAGHSSQTVSLPNHEDSEPTIVSRSVLCADPPPISACGSETAGPEIDRQCSNEELKKHYGTQVATVHPCLEEDRTLPVARNQSIEAVSYLNLLPTTSDKMEAASDSAQALAALGTQELEPSQVRMTRLSGGQTAVHEQNVQSTTPDRLPGEQMKCGVMDDETKWETDGQENKAGKKRKLPSESVKRLPKSPKETLLFPSTVADGALPDDADGSSGSLTASSPQGRQHPLRIRKSSVMLQDAMLLVEAMGQSKNRISAQENATAQGQCTASVARSPLPHQAAAPESPPTTNESHRGVEEESPSETPFDTRTTEPGNSQPLRRDSAVPQPNHGIEPSDMTPTSLSAAAVSNSLEQCAPHPGSVLAEPSETMAGSDLVPPKIFVFSKTPSSNSQGMIAPLSPNQISAVVSTVAAAQNECTSSAGLPQRKNDTPSTTADPFMMSKPTVSSTEQSPGPTCKKITIIIRRTADVVTSQSQLSEAQVAPPRPNSIGPAVTLSSRRPDVGAQVTSDEKETLLLTDQTPFILSRLSPTHPECPSRPPSICESPQITPAEQEAALSSESAPISCPLSPPRPEFLSQPNSDCESSEIPCGEEAAAISAGSVTINSLLSSPQVDGSAQLTGLCESLERTPPEQAATLSTVNMPQKSFPLVPVIRLKRLSHPVLSTGSVLVSQLLSRERKSEVVQPDSTSSLVNDQTPKTMLRPSVAAASSTGTCPKTKNAFVAQTSSVSSVSEEAVPSSALREAVAPALSPCAPSNASEPVSKKTVDFGETGLSAGSDQACKTVTPDEKGIKNAEKDLVSQNDFSNPLQSTPITRDLSKPHLQLTKTEFLAQFAVKPVIQDAKKTSSSESADGQRSCEGPGRMSNSHRKSFFARLGVHLKTRSQAKRAKTNPRPLTEAMDIRERPAKKTKLENAGRNEHKSTHELRPLPTNTASGSRTEMEFSPASLGNRRRTTISSPESKTPFEPASVSPRKPIVSLYRLPLKDTIEPHAEIEEKRCVKQAPPTAAVTRQSSAGKNEDGPNDLKAATVCLKSSRVQNIATPSNTKFPAKSRKRSLSPKENANVEKIHANCSPGPSAQAKTLPSPPRIKSIGAHRPPRITPVRQTDSGSIPNDSRPQPCHSNSIGNCIFSRGEKTSKQESDTFLGETASPKWTENGASSSKIEAGTAKNSSLNQKSPAEENNIKGQNAKKLAKAARSKVGKDPQTKRMKMKQPINHHVDDKKRNKCTSHTVCTPKVRAREAMRLEPRAAAPPMRPRSGNGKKLLKNKCEECGRILSSSAALESHSSLHTGHRPFCCTRCGKCFPDAKGLKRHGQVHCNGRLHICQQCGKGFVYGFGLNKHLQMVHGKRKPFVCQLCNKAFFTKRDVETHIRTHTGEKPFHCHLCEKKFVRSVELNAHLRWHRGEKRHWCPYCGKGFFDQNNLKRHKYIHTGEKPHSCPHCPKHFTQSGHLKKHVKNVHKVQ